MDPDEWEKLYAEFEARMAKIDAIYKWKLALIERQRKVSAFFLVGYIVLLTAGIVFTNYAVMLAAVPCALACIASMLWVTYQLHANPYPGDEP